ncbi:ferritin-like domain-containing protein [Erythrobacter sp. WG]|uniref:ferritin-like domain-containing protein n=1 Tax=Erythrobacter sp. WG TaxID=2985510 RepID=UPI00226F7BE1|nr:PA2169 family four-helix-bundle protein [Erythrobacter sp. WG]MCX9146521.1 PA2169 family four-helix-bundle protein [Erythrobacter sp. WG]
MNANTTALETLIDTTYDSVEGYRKAAETAKSPELKRILSEQAAKRQKTLDALNTELTRLGGKLVTKGTATGGLHRLWMDLTNLFESDDKAAVERVEEGEDYLADKFEEALKATDLDPNTRSVIQTALGEVREGERLTDRLEEQYD